MKGLEKVSSVDNQKKTLEYMVKLYCRKNHNPKEEICDECEELLNYALNRLDNCRYGDKKPNCGNCKNCCYNKDMRIEIKKIMKYSGPRMIFYNPRMTLKHILNKKGK